MANQCKERQSRLSSILGLPVLILLFPLLVVVFMLYILVGTLLHTAAWCFWCTQGRDVLLVYSNSPIWQSYVEENLLPRLHHRAIVLNWSHRRTWRRTLAVALFRFFGGSYDYNPMAIVFRPFRIARSFRFYKPFRDYKHGHRETVAELTERLFAMVESRN